jgi:hypothetical protein
LRLVPSAHPTLPEWRDQSSSRARLPRLIEFAISIGFTVEDAELPGSINGDCTHELHRIRVEISNSPAQRVKTLAREIGHALLHEQFDN